MSSTVTVVVESNDVVPPRSPGRSSAAQRKSSGIPLAAWIVIGLVLLSGGLALFDLYLLLAGLN
jgi:hypothetical protein